MAKYSNTCFQFIDLESQQVQEIFPPSPAALNGMPSGMIFEFFKKKFCKKWQINTNSVTVKRLLAFSVGTIGF